MTAVRQHHSDATAQTDLETLVGNVELYEQVFERWDGNQRATVDGYRQAVDALHREAFARLIRSLRASPAALEAMKDSVGDDVVYAVLRRFGLLKPSLQERVEAALDSVRPMLATHGGGVDLVAVRPPDAVEIRFLGACDGCPASMLTFIAGVKKAIEEACPEITEIKQAKGLGNGAGETVNFVSPFALGRDGDWRHVIDLADLPDGSIRPVALDGQDLLLARIDTVVSCFHNACAHLGMQIDSGDIDDGIITCPHHGFRYDLRSGECLTAPEVQLQSHAVRIIGARVEVRLAR